MKPNINSVELHPQLSNNGHPVDGCAGSLFTCQWIFHPIRNKSSAFFIFSTPTHVNSECLIFCFMPRYKLPSLLIMMVEPDHGEWESWMSRRPSSDLFLNGTFFTDSGTDSRVICKVRQSGGENGQFRDNRTSNM